MRPPLLTSFLKAVLFAAFMAASVGPATATTIEELAARIRALEERNEQLQSEVRALKKAVPATLPAVALGEATPQAGSPAATKTAPAPRSGPSELLGKERSALNFDRPLGAAPAFVALDVTPETVDNPATPREFAASLLNGVDRKGILQSGIAMEVAPYQLFAGAQTSLAEYRAGGFSGYMTRLLYNASLSLATTKASADDDKAERVAAGLSFNLFDKGDPRLNPAIDQLLSDVTRQVPVYVGSAFLTEAENQAAAAAYYANYPDPNALFLDGLEKIRAASWGRTAWNVAVAPTWISRTGKAGDLEGDGYTIWSTFAYGFENTSLQGKFQFLAHVRYRQDERVADPDDKSHFFQQDSLFAAGRLRWGRPDLNFSIEGAYINTMHGPGSSGSAYRLGGGIEKRVSENVWLVLTAGEDFGAANGSDEIFALGALRFGSADSPRFSP